MTALLEQRGDAVDVTLTSGGSPYYAALDSYPGRVRLYIMRPQSAGLVFRLPDHAAVRQGCKPNVTVINRGPNTLAVRTRDGVTLVTTVPVNQSAEFFALPNGNWYAIAGILTAASSGTLNALRIPFFLTYTASSVIGTNFRTDVARQFGYVSSMGPVALTVVIGPNVVLGRLRTDAATAPAVDAGMWPSGSTLLIEMSTNSYIHGRGGQGGQNQSGPVGSPGPVPGAAGGPALVTRMPTTIILPTTGFVRGGGGGGGGAARTAGGIAGGYGGGGAGAEPGLGKGVGPSQPTDGQPGTLDAGGAGGFVAGGNTGGFGGFPGLPGVAGVGGAPGGAAGRSIRRLFGVPAPILIGSTGNVVGPQEEADV